MKKTVCLLVIALLIASVAFAAQQKAQKPKITNDNLASLKGTWEGTISFGEYGAANSPAKLEIMSDKAPVKAKLTVMNVPNEVASRLGQMSGTSMFESEDGEITTQGTLMFAGNNKNFLELVMRSDKKLMGSYFFKGVKGDLNLNKK